MPGLVVGVFRAVAAGAEMTAVAEATLEPGRGLVGDRYYAGVGTFSEKLKGRADAEITLVEFEEVSRFNVLEGASLTPATLRRNIVTSGVRLNDLVGKQFRVGRAVLEGIRLCEPCAHLAEIVAPSVVPVLVHRAGLRARIVEGAVVRTGDVIVAQPDA